MVTTKQVKTTDAYAINAIGVPSMVLMERATMWATRAAEETAGKVDMIWAVYGTGNNGADGMVITRMLYLKGHKTDLFVVRDPDRGTVEFLTRSAIARNPGMQMRPWQGTTGEDRVVLIDTVFGVGLSCTTEGEYRQYMKMLEAWYAAHTVAVDTPSGIHGDASRIMRVVPKVNATATLGWEEMGTALYPGRACAGAIRAYSIGLPESALDTVRNQGEGYGYGLTYESSDLCLILDRPAYSNKGTFGRVLIVAGSKNIYGVAYSNALAAYRTGAGFVELPTVEKNHQALQERLPEAIITTYTSDQLIQGREELKKIIEEQMNRAGVVMPGPRLGSEPYVEYLVEDILASAFVPVIIDADGLNTIAGHPYLATYFTENIIITPHLGETVRLISENIDVAKENLTETALEYAGYYGIICVLEDAATMVVGKDDTLYVNSSGNSAMAKAGSSDMFTGVIVGLAAIGMEEEQAVLMGVYLHEHAGEQAAGKIGQYSLLTSNLAGCIGTAMRSVTHE